MMNYEYIITSDTHFNHAKLIEYCHRPKNFSELIYKHLAGILCKDSILIHLGDICIGADELVHDKFIISLPGKKILVKGNHDRKSTNWYLNHGWDFVCNYFALEIFGKKIKFTHIPIIWDGEWELNIHGHLHNLTHREVAFLKPWHFLISMEQNNYHPYLLRNVVQDVTNKLNTEE